MALHYDEKGKFFTDYISKEAVQAIIQTTANRIEGQIYVRTNERVSDSLNAGGPFLAVTKAVIFNLDGHELMRMEFLAVNQNQIIWLAPLEEEKPDESFESQP